MTTPDDPYAAPGPDSTPPANPYGQPAYAQPAYGQPAYGQQQPGTSGLAIASLVCAFVGLITCGVASIVGFILGLVALSQITRTNQGGRGLALAGIWVSAVIVVLGIIAAIIFGVFVANEVEKCDNGTYTGQEYQDKC